MIPALPTPFPRPFLPCVLDGGGPDPPSERRKPLPGVSAASGPMPSLVPEPPSGCVGPPAKQAPRDTERRHCRQAGRRDGETKGRGSTQAAAPAGFGFESDSMQSRKWTHGWARWDCWPGLPPPHSKGSLFIHTPSCPFSFKCPTWGLGWGGGQRLSTKKIMLGPREALSFWGDARAPSLTYPCMSRDWPA